MRMYKLGQTPATRGYIHSSNDNSYKKKRERNCLLFIVRVYSSASKKNNTQKKTTRITSININVNMNNTTQHQKKNNIQQEAGEEKQPRTSTSTFNKNDTYEQKGSKAATHGGLFVVLYSGSLLVVHTKPGVLLPGAVPTTATKTSHRWFQADKRLADVVAPKSVLSTSSSRKTPRWRFNADKRQTDGFMSRNASPIVSCRGTPH